MTTYLTNVKAQENSLKKKPKKYYKTSLHAKVRKCHVVGRWERGLASLLYSFNKSEACLQISVGWVCICLNWKQFLAFHIDHAIIDHTSSSFLSKLPIICRASMRKLLAAELLFCDLGCTDTPFLASCRCRTRVGHRNGYDSPDSGVRRVSSFFFFFFSFLRHAPTRL